MARRHASTTIFEQMRSVLAQAGAPDTVYYIDRQELGAGKLFLKAVDKLSGSERERFDNEYPFAIEQMLSRTFEDAQHLFSLWADYDGLSKKNIGNSAFSKHYMVYVEGSNKHTEFSGGYLKRWGKALEMTAHEDITVLTIYRPYPDNFDAFVEPLLETPWEQLHTLRFMLGSDFAREKGVEHGAWALKKMCQRWHSTLEHIHLELPEPRHLTRNSPLPQQRTGSRSYNYDHASLYTELTASLLAALLESAPATLREVTLWNWPDDKDVLSRLLAAFPALTRLTFMSAGGRTHLDAIREDPNFARLEGLRLGCAGSRQNSYDLEHQRQCEKLSLDLGAKGLKHWHHVSRTPDANQRHVFTWAHPWRDLLFQARKQAAGIETKQTSGNAHNAIRVINTRGEDISPQLWRAIIEDQEGAARQFQGMRTLVMQIQKLESVALLLERLPICFPNVEYLDLGTVCLPDDGIDLPRLPGPLEKLTSLRVKTVDSSPTREVELVRALLGEPAQTRGLLRLYCEFEHIDAHAEVISMATHHADHLVQLSLTGLTDEMLLEDYLDRLLQVGLADIIEQTRDRDHLWWLFPNGDAFARYVTQAHLPEHFRNHLIACHFNPRANILKPFFVEAAQTLEIKGISSMRKEEVMSAIADHLEVELPELEM